MKFSLRVALLSLVLASAATIPQVACAIVVRDDVPDAAYLGFESDFPAIFSLYRTKAGHRDCLATLIAPNYAITAAHCTDVKRLTDALGTDDGYPVEVAGSANSIRKVLLPPKRADGSQPDVALLKLRAAVEGVAPLKLHAAHDEAGRIVKMPGWGGAGTGKSGAIASDGLFRVAENRVDRAENGRLYWAFEDPATGKALTLEGISGPGDSGGPALLLTDNRWEVAGISSAQRNGDGPEGTYGVEEVFVRVSDLAGWIEQVMRSAN